MTSEEESLRRGERFAQATAAVAFLFAFFYFLYNPTPLPTAVETPTDLPTRTPTAAATATVTETIATTLVLLSTPTATMTPSTIYDEPVVWVRRIVEPCCTREQITEISSGRLGVGIEMLPLRPFAIEKSDNLSTEGRVWLARPDQGMVLSFADVQHCGVAVFGEQGPFAFCLQGDSYQPFNLKMLAGKDSVGLDPVWAQSVHPGIDKYRGPLVTFNKSDLPR